MKEDDEISFPNQTFQNIATTNVACLSLCSVKRHKGRAQCETSHLHGAADALMRRVAHDQFGPPYLSHELEVVIIRWQ
jgi:hypothetical protein